MARDKAKTYYMRDYHSDQIMTGMSLDDVKGVVLQLYKEDVRFDVFEYGLFEERGMGYRLDQKRNVTNKFMIVNGKVEYHDK